MEMSFKQFYKWNPTIPFFFEKGKTILIGHRGAPFLANENTLESFKCAFEANLKGVELDIQLSKDKKLFIFHDWKIKTNQEKAYEVSKLDYSKILSISKQNNFIIPLLKDIIKILQKKRFLNIEIKSMNIINSGIEKYLLELLIENNILNRVIISSFNPLSIYRIKKINQNVLTAFLWTNRNSCLLINTPLWAWFCKPDGFHIDYNSINNKIINWVKSKKMFLLTYTINNKKDYSIAKKLNFHGVFTDNPNLLTNNNESQKNIK